MDHLDGRVYDAPFVLECWTVLSALAVAAPGVALGPLVLNVANRHPGVLATMAATLQEVSGGRLMLGLGAGGGGPRYVREQEAIGRTVDPDPLRRSHVETCIQEVRRLWHSPGFLAPDPEPPFVIGASGPKMAELAGRLGDGLNLRATHPRLGELVEVARGRRTRARAAVRNGSWSRSMPRSTSSGLPPIRRRTPVSPRSAPTASSSP